MLLPRAITGGAPFAFAGRHWWLRITYRVLSQVEQATGVDMLAASEDVARPSSRLIRALLWACLCAAGASFTEREVGAKLHPGNLFAAHQAVIDSWISSMPDPKAVKKGQENKGPRPVSKPLTWLEAWATARQQLKLSDAEWLDMTPRQLHALRNVYLERMQHEEMMTGIISSTVANYGFCRPKRAVSPESFMLHPFDPPEYGPVTGEMIMAVFAPIKEHFRKVS